MRRRRRRRRGRGGTPSAKITKASTIDDASASTVLHFILGPDPLAKALGARSDPLDLPIFVDPMMDELAAVLITRSAPTPAPGYRSPEGQTLLWDPTSMAPQCTAESPLLSHVQGAPTSAAAPSEEFPPSPGDALAGQVSSGGPTIAPHYTADPPMLLVPGAPLAPLAGTTTLSEDESPSPSPREAARRLARFTEVVRVARPPPLISSPLGKRRCLGGPCPRGAGGLPLSGWTTSQCPNAAKCSS
jgi:hypothetical protein